MDSDYFIIALVTGGIPAHAYAYSSRCVGPGRRLARLQVLCALEGHADFAGRGTDVKYCGYVRMMPEFGQPPFSRVSLSCKNLLVRNKTEGEFQSDSEPAIYFSSFWGRLSAISTYILSSYTYERKYNIFGSYY